MESHDGFEEIKRADRFSSSANSQPDWPITFGIHEVMFTHPEELADKIIEASFD